MIESGINVTPIATLGRMVLLHPIKNLLVREVGGQEDGMKLCTMKSIVLSSLVVEDKIVISTKATKAYIGDLRDNRTRHDTY